MKLLHNAIVASVEEIAEGIFLMVAEAGELTRQSAPGQFVNVRLGDGYSGPLLRRPFSISRVENDTFELLFNIVGEGTRRLAEKRRGDVLDVLGPLGRPFRYRSDFDTAILVAGGLGVAPFPFLTQYLQKEEKQVVTLLGVRTRTQVISRHLSNLSIATDDGSAGFHGTVVGLLEEYLATHSPSRPKIFGCGPTKMMKALSDVALRRGIECELSLEGDMGCGIGICQGCPVEVVNGEKKYALVCTQGPTFPAPQIVLPSW